MQGKYLFLYAAILLFAVVRSRSVSKELFELAEKINDKWNINKKTEEEFLEIIGFKNNDFSVETPVEGGADLYVRKNNFYKVDNIKNELEIPQENIENQNESLEDDNVSSVEIEIQNDNSNNNKDGENEIEDVIVIKENKNKNVGSEEKGEVDNEEEDYDDGIENEDIKILEQEDDHDGDNAVFGVLDYLNDKSASEEKPDEYEYKEEIERYRDMDYIPDDYFDNSEYER